MSSDRGADISDYQAGVVSQLLLLEPNALTFGLLLNLLDYGSPIHTISLVHLDATSLGALDAAIWSRVPPTSGCEWEDESPPTRKSEVMSRCATRTLPSE